MSTDLDSPVESSYLVGLFVPSHHAHRLDEGVSRVVHPSLDALVQGVPVGGHLVPEAGVDARCQALGHAVVVLAQVGVVSAAGRGTRGITVSPGQSYQTVCGAKSLCAALNFRREGPEHTPHCTVLCAAQGHQGNGAQRDLEGQSPTETSHLSLRKMPQH